MNETDMPQMDWQQVALNGGPPCFYVEGQKFCGRAERWAGHGGHGVKAIHEYVSLDDLLLRRLRAEWRSIETAPLNESVLIFIPNLLAEHYGPAIYRGLCVESYNVARVWKVSGLHSGRDCGVDYWPTHWQPLPDPPEVKS